MLIKDKEYTIEYKDNVKTVSGIRYSGWSGSKSVRLN